MLDHPVTGERVVGFVARGVTRKLGNLRKRPLVTVAFRSGWDWVAIGGGADLAGPDDHLKGLAANDVPLLLRELYAAAVGGVPDDWARLDSVMAAERHTAVLIRPRHVYSNPARRHLTRTGRSAIPRMLGPSTRLLATTSGARCCKGDAPFARSSR